MSPEENEAGIREERADVLSRVVTMFEQVLMEGQSEPVVTGIESSIKVPSMEPGTLSFND